MKRLITVTLLALLATVVLAHETQVVGEGDDAVRIVVGFAQEPPFTEERNGFDIIITRVDGTPVEGLARSLLATLVAPDGSTRREFELRERHGQPGRYTADFLLTAPGVYSVLIAGFVGDLELDVSFELHEVRPLDELRFP